MSTSVEAVVEEDLAAFRTRARAWLAANASPRSDVDDDRSVGSDNVAVFHNLPFEEEKALLERVCAWQRAKFDAGFGALSWPKEAGELGSRRRTRACSPRRRAGSRCPLRTSWPR